LKAWLSIVWVIGSQLVALAGIVFITWVFPTLAAYWQTPAGTFSVFVIGACVALVFVILITRPKSVSEFLVRFKFQLSWTAISYSVIALGSIFGCVGILVARLDLTHFAEKYALTKPFIHEHGLAQYLLPLLMLTGPIYEEIVLRGYVYQTFRKEHGVCLSVVAVVVVALVLHSPVIRVSIWAFLLIVAVQSVSCLVLEKTNNLWNCILFHCVYNGMLIIGPKLGF
jgi:membrane protease YdiL (CAAX protease family)